MRTSFMKIVFKSITKSCLGQNFPLVHEQSARPMTVSIINILTINRSVYGHTVRPKEMSTLQGVCFIEIPL